MTATTSTPARRTRTSIGKKQLVAASGILGLAFVFAHMIGNLKAFLGPSQINRYGEFLRDMGEPLFPRSFLLWTLRLTLIAGVTLHIFFTVQLALQSRAARPVRYVKTANVDADPASKTMRWGGLMIVLFLVFHLMDFTWGVHPDFVRGDVYHNMVTGFTRVPVFIVYLFAMIALGLHIYHGTWSVTQTLGVNRARWDRTIRRFATTAAVVIAGGFMLTPIGVLFRIIH